MDSKPEEHTRIRMALFTSPAEQFTDVNSFGDNSVCGTVKKIEVKKKEY